MSGTILEIMINIGEQVKLGQTLFKVVDISTVWATFEIYESQISDLSVDQAIEINRKNSPHEVFLSKITSIEPIVNEQTKTLKIKAILPNPK